MRSDGATTQRSFRLSARTLELLEERAAARDVSRNATAEYLGVDEASVRAAIAYYADFRDEVEDDVEAAAVLAREERGRWERQQLAMG